MSKSQRFIREKKYANIKETESRDETHPHTFIMLYLVLGEAPAPSGFQTVN